MVRAALGYDRVHLFGTSYGARLALQVARDHPDGLASLELSSPIPAEENFVTDLGTSFDRALDALDRACAAQPSCDGPYPHLLDTLESTLDRLQAQPAALTVTDPATGQARVVQVEAADVALIVYTLFYAPAGPAVLPALITALGQGDFSLLATPGATPAAISPISSGMQVSVLCAEEARDASPADIDPPSTLAARLVLATAPIAGPNLARICQVWDVDAGSPDTFTPVVTFVPTLIATGQFDQVTPPAYGAEIAAVIPNEQLVEIPGVGHSPLLAAGACGLAMLDSYLENPWQGADTSCLPAEAQFLTPDQLAELLQATPDPEAVSALSQL
jgi:pimeloyl-ACP methyl ester carboxylesterase